MCDVEFKLVRELDELDEAYSARRRVRHKVLFPSYISQPYTNIRKQTFWWPALMWAINMLRYRQDGGTVWRPMDLLDPKVPLVKKSSGERPRPRPIRPKTLLKKPIAVKFKKTPSPVPPPSKTVAPVTPVASTSSSAWPAGSWPSSRTLRKIAEKDLDAMSVDDIEEIEGIAMMLRDFARERSRTKSPEL